MEEIQMPKKRRMVCYWSHGSADGVYPGLEDNVGVITHVYEPDNPHSKVRLFVITNTGQHHNDVAYSDVPLGGHWSWPSRD
jgi:hypothetical protein